MPARTTVTAKPKSPREAAKFDVRMAIRDNAITTTKEYSWRELRRVLHYELAENYGYSNPTTRNCIISEAAREAGIAPKRDSYRTKVYRFEDKAVLEKEFSGRVTMGITEADAIEMVEAATAWLAPNMFGKRMPVPQVTFGTRGNSSWARGYSRIHIQEHMKTPHTVLHELAHSYCSFVNKDKGHGPHFMATMFALFVAMGYISRNNARDILANAPVPTNVDYFNHLMQKCVRD